MKLLYCQRCGDIVSPSSRASQPRTCECGVHAVWWRDPYLGTLSVFDKTRRRVTYLDKEGDRRTTTAKEWGSTCFILGLANTWLNHPGDRLSLEDYKKIVDEIPDSYIFKTVRSPAIRIRPGHSSDTKYEDALPGQEPNPPEDLGTVVDFS